MGHTYHFKKMVTNRLNESEIIIEIKEKWQVIDIIQIVGMQFMLRSFIGLIRNSNCRDCPIKMNIKVKIIANTGMIADEIKNRSL